MSLTDLVAADGEDRGAESKSVPEFVGNIREYWIAADEVMWDYAPSFPINLMSGEEFTDDQKVFVEEGIGRTYLKSVYREYTPGFGALIERSEEENAYLGLLGPIIRAEVGETIIVHFKNNTRFPASIHPHGVFYTKTSEGARYNDGTEESGKADDTVFPGSSYTYVWSVPRRAGPAKRDPSSIMWPYHSHVHTTADTNAGLIGAIIITRKGMANADGSPRDIDREFVSLFNVYDENVSNYLDVNLGNCTSGICDPDDEDFQESNLMHGINGLLWGNNTYTMNKGERVRWHVFAMGTEVDLHTPHWHGATLKHNGNRVDVTEILPAASKSLTFRPDIAGTWMYHCHVNDHLDAGMMTVFTVLEN
ncbi:MAG: copper oxidase [Candidatus Scalindua sp. AMX11]|nr:MAG: copper oxidase [Candidatus Scalindua sp.]NOG84864.1 multicopper oxidase domain-containing protein [Planctomycetota bacterium]RZV85010.1 MAG: copper oxidase [Candidatus Scalindua sp. SCAELEC01]TDE65102.1 MAG: copper oxidase [Candidatus Scalindua sp. AMX11]